MVAEVTVEQAIARGKEYRDALEFVLKDIFRITGYRKAEELRSFTSVEQARKMLEQVRVEVRNA